MDRDSERADPWQYLLAIGEAERHFNEIESKYRALASTWLLASFAGMGFIIESTSFPIEKELVILGIAISGSVGIQLIWVIDVLAYHRLLQSYFVEGLVIEYQNPEFPQARWNMLALTRSVADKVRMFYAGCSLALIPFGLIALAIRDSTPDWITLVGSGGVILILSTIWFLWHRSGHQIMNIFDRREDVMNKPSISNFIDEISKRMR